MSDPYTPDIGTWAEQKYRLVSNYAAMFSTSMRGKWKELVYIDLFAGAGMARIRETNRIVPTSPLLAMDVPNPFDRYVLCDKDEECVDALRRRVQDRHPEVDARYLLGDSNSNVGSVLAELPLQHPRERSLSFCMVDPFRIRNFAFNTIESIASEIAVDFLVLIPSHMDAHREQVLYSKDHHTSISRFVGSSDWRDRRFDEPGDFGTFVVQEFGRSMERIGYINDPDSHVLIFRTGTRVKLYYLSFFSRHEVGMKLWRGARKYSTEQLPLFGSD